MEALNLSKKSGWTKEQNEETTAVTLKSLADLTGFPVEFIKEELLLTDEEISMPALRQKIQSFLVNNFDQVNA